MKIKNNALSSYFYLMTTLYAATSILAIVKFGWRQPMFDQWRMYPLLLKLPFPQNVIQLENGHRPIFPNLIRVAEINWLSANQILQLSLGTICVVGAAVLGSIAILRQRGWSQVHRAMGVMLITLGTLWLGNARMLLHGHESLHAYLVVLCILLAGLCVFEAKKRNSVKWVVLSCFACVVATFSFGPGVSSFIGVIALGIVLRAPWRWLLFPIATLTLCLALYLFLLPGNEGVRGSLELSPLRSGLLATQWLSSPWVNGWLGSADPQAPWVFINNRTWLGSALIWSANQLTNASGLSWRSLSALFGGTGVCYFLYKTIVLYSKKEELTSVQAFAICVGFFVLATSITVSITRLDYMSTHSDQVYADRYLLWPSLFWCSLLLLVLCDLAQRNEISPKMARMASAFFLALPIALLPTQRAGAVWGSMVYRSAQALAAALRSDVYPEDALADDPASASAEKLQALNEFRKRHLAMYSNATWENIGAHWDGKLYSSTVSTTNVYWKEMVVDLNSTTPARHFEGCVTGLAGVAGNGQLTVLGEDGAIAGFGEYSYIEPKQGTLASIISPKNCFDGYVKEFNPSVTYALAMLDFHRKDGILLEKLKKEARQ